VPHKCRKSWKSINKHMLLSSFFSTALECKFACIWAAKVGAQCPIYTINICVFCKLPFSHSSLKIRPKMWKSRLWGITLGTEIGFRAMSGGPQNSIDFRSGFEMHLAPKRFQIGVNPKQLLGHFFWLNRDKHSNELQKQIL